MSDITVDEAAESEVTDKPPSQTNVAATSSVPAVDNLEEGESSLRSVISWTSRSSYHLSDSAKSELAPGVEQTAPDADFVVDETIPEDMEVTATEQIDEEEAKLEETKPQAEDALQTVPSETAQPVVEGEDNKDETDQTAVEPEQTLTQTEQTVVESEPISTDAEPPEEAVQPPDQVEQAAEDADETKDKTEETDKAEQPEAQGDQITAEDEQKISDLTITAEVEQEESPKAEDEVLYADAEYPTDEKEEGSIVEQEIEDSSSSDDEADRISVAEAFDDALSQIQDEVAKYVVVEETVLNDLGKEIKIKQKIPIIRETRRFERISVPGQEGEKPKHIFLEQISKFVKKSQVTADGEIEEYEDEYQETIEHLSRPSTAQEVYASRINDEGEVEEVLVDEEEPLSILQQRQIEEARKQAREIRMQRMKEKKTIIKKRVMKLVKETDIEPCSQGKVREVMKPKIADIEVEEESEIEDYFLDEEETEGLTEEELAAVREQQQRKRDERIGKLKDNLRTVLVRLALAEKKRNLYMQLISISAEVKEDTLNPPPPDMPSFKVPKKTKVEDKFKKLYLEKLMEYRELRSVILVKLALEKKRKEEVKKKYDVIASEVAQLKKDLEEKLYTAQSKLLPKNDPVFKNQSPQMMVRRVMDLIERLDNETKELMYKKKQMYLAKQKYDKVTENEEGLGYKYALASKELQDLVSKNDRRNEKLESVKVTMQKESIAISHINQKCEAVLKNKEEKNAKLEFLNQDLNRIRQDRKDVHLARRKVETELKQERAKFKLKNHPSLIKEHKLIKELLISKQMEFQHLKDQCLSSIEYYKQNSSSQK